MKGPIILGSVWAAILGNSHAARNDDLSLFFIWGSALSYR